MSVTILGPVELTRPVIAAPMAGGPSTTALVIAAAQGGSLGFLAGGYKSAQVLADEMAAVRAASVPFGVNLFAPNPVPIDQRAYRRYADAIRAELDRFDVTGPDEPREDDDAWADKIDVLLAAPPPLVSFTFGIPDPDVRAALHRAGSTVVQTVTSPAEARLATESGVDLLAVQAAAAGGHSGTLTPQIRPSDIPLADLVAQVRAVTSLPLIAAGGVATAGDVSAALRAGAVAVAVGTALMRTDESGASLTHRAALVDPNRAQTVVTHAFTGRPARALMNDFIARYDPVAPFGYPALHHLTSPMRRAAAAAGDPERVHLWAGTGFRQARTGSVASVLAELAASV